MAEDLNEEGQMGPGDFEVLKTVRGRSGHIGATDVILELRSPSLAENTLRRSIWRLVSRGQLALDENLQLVAIA
jgi:hypothetical protein